MSIVIVNETLEWELVLIEYAVNVVKEWLKNLLKPNDGRIIWLLLGFGLSAIEILATSHIKPSKPLNNAQIANLN